MCFVGVMPDETKIVPNTFFTSLSSNHMHHISDYDFI